MGLPLAQSYLPVLPDREQSPDQALPSPLQDAQLQLGPLQQLAQVLHGCGAEAAVGQVHMPAQVTGETSMTSTMAVHHMVCSSVLLSALEML